MYVCRIVLDKWKIGVVWYIMNFSLCRKGSGGTLLISWRRNLFVSLELFQTAEKRKLRIENSIKWFHLLLLVFLTFHNLSSFIYLSTHTLWGYFGHFKSINSSLRLIYFSPFVYIYFINNPLNLHMRKLNVKFLP